MFGILFKSTFAALAIVGNNPARHEYKVTELAFMTGNWSTIMGHSVIEEHWMAPSSGSLLGMMREEVDGKTAIREFEVIEETPEGIFMNVKHFDAKMTELPGRKLSRKLVSITNNEVVFEESGPEPRQKLIYRKEGVDGLHAALEITRNGKPNRIEFPMKRMK